MNRSTGIAPSRRMRSRRLSASAPTEVSVRALDIGSRWRALGGLAQYPDAGGDHGQGIEDAGGERSKRQKVTFVGLAEEFAERAREPVAQEKRARDHSGT